MAVDVQLAGYARSRKPLTIQWTQQSGPDTAVFDDATNPATTVTLPAAGTYVFRLTAGDGELSSFDEVTVTAGANVAPVVNAGSDAVILSGQVYQLAATATDDGNPPPPTLTYAWTKVSGPGTPVFSNAAILSPTVTIPTAGTYVLRLAVSDGDLTTTDDVQLVVSSDIGTMYVHATAANASESITDVEYRIDLSTISNNDWWAACTTSGGNIRPTDASDNLLPFDLIAFNKSGKTGFMIVKRNASTSNGATRLWTGNPNLVLPAVDDVIGQYNAYGATTEGFWPTGSGNDRTAHQRHLTFSGGSASLVDGPIGIQATDYDGTDDFAYYNFWPDGVTFSHPISLTATAKRTGSSHITNDTLLGLNRTNAGTLSSLANTHRVQRAQTTSNVVALAGGNGTATNISEEPANTWVQYGSTSAVVGGTYFFNSFSLTDLDVSSTGGQGVPSAMDRFVVGAAPNFFPAALSNEFHDGEICLVRLASANDTVKCRYHESMLDQATFWGTWTAVTP